MDEQGDAAEPLGTVIATERVVAHVLDGDSVLGPATGGGDGLLRGVLVHDEGVQMYTVDDDSLLGPVYGASCPEDALDPGDADFLQSSGCLASFSDDAIASDLETIEDPGSQVESAVGGAVLLNTDVGGDAGQDPGPGAADNLSGDRPAH